MRQVSDCFVERLTLIQTLSCLAGPGKIKDVPDMTSGTSSGSPISVTTSLGLAYELALSAFVSLRDR